MRSLATYTRHPDRWILVSLGLLAAVTVADLLGGQDVSVIALLVVAPLVASLALGPRATAAIALAAALIAIALGVPNGFFGESEHLTRAVPVAVGGLLAVGMARLREQRERAATLLSVQGSVASILNESSNSAEAFPRMLATIGASLGWEVGALWAVDESADVLRRTARWSAPGVDQAAFEEVSGQAQFERGAGFPGHVWATEQARSVANVQTDEHFLRTSAAAAAGLHGGFAFPVSLGERVVGVVEFFTREAREPERAYLDTLASLGSQIGQFMQRTQAQDDVRSSEALKTAVLDSAFDCVVTMNHEGCVVDFNPAAERTFGYSREEVVGKEMADLIIPPQLRERHRSGLARYMETGEGAVIDNRIEITGWRSDGSEFPVELSITRINADGPPLFSGYIRDITDSKRAEEERARLLDAEHSARVVAEQAERTKAESLALLDTLIAKAPIGLAFVDPDLRFVRANDALAAMYGLTSGDELGRTAADVMTGVPDFAAHLHQVLATDEAVIDIETAGEIPGSPGRERHWLSSYYPVRGFSETLGVGVVVAEITDRKLAERRAAFLADATAALGASLDFDLTVGSLVQTAVPDLADWCVLDMLDEDKLLRRSAVAHVEPGKERLAWDLAQRYPFDESTSVGRDRIMRTGRSQLVSNMTQELLESLSRDDEHFSALRELGFESAMLVPLKLRGDTVGVLSFGAYRANRRFDESDLALAEELAERAATAVENARLYRERSYIARTLQESLLPPSLPEIPGVELAARYRAAGEGNQVGGDFYDIFQTGEDTWATVIGDVRGKGADAAALIGLARHTLRAAAMREGEPTAILSTLNEALYREDADDSFCTALYAAVEITSSGARLELTSAGHPLPLLLRANGRVETVGLPGTLVGAVPELDLNSDVAHLSPGDAVVLYTDGVPEARSTEDFFGQERLVSVLKACSGANATALAERIERDVLEFQDGDPRDDVAILVLRVPSKARLGREPEPTRAVS